MSGLLLHDKAKRLIPGEEEAAGRRHWVAVLYTGKAAQDDLIEQDFLWIKAHGKISMEKIITSCRNSLKDDLQETDFDLMLDGTIPRSTILLKDLNHYQDNLIVLQKVPKQKPPPNGTQETRAPLKPIQSTPPVLMQPSEVLKKAFPNSANQTAQPFARTFSNLVSPQKENFSFPPPLKTPQSPRYQPAYVGPYGHQTTVPYAAPPQSSQLAPQPSPHSVGSPSLPSTMSPSPHPAMQPLPLAGLQSSPHPPFPSSPVSSQPPLSPMAPPQTRPSPTLGNTPQFGMSNGIPARMKVEEEMDSNHYASYITESSPPHRNRSMKPEADFTPLASVPASEHKDPAIPQLKPEPPTDDDFEAEERPNDVFLQQLLEQRSPEILEAGVTKALKIIRTLKTTLSQQEDVSPDAKQWMNSLIMLEKQAERKRTVVGVVGNTGAGKSSVINAMLDEERLVPTNCMRACTAVVTEMSWNDDPNPSTKYRAEIEFISPEAWAKELDALLKEVLTESGTVSRECADENSDAGIAWAKFKAVYPKKTKDMLAEVDVASLMREKSVMNVLGTTKKISEARPELFYRQLQHYVDSKEKVTNKSKNKDKNKQPREMEYWPLIKVVKIYTKSPALSTGAVIVDLPGVHDSNAARAAVAQGYLKQCTGLWIVAPITRAVDDKAAKTLLGDSFKRQLKYDGGFSAVTFICSKTDDISITEAADSLELDDQISEYQDQEDAYGKKLTQLQEKVDALRESAAVYKDVVDNADEDIEMWEKLLDDLQDGKMVYEPKKATSKRKRGETKKKPKKRRQRSDSDMDSDDDFIASDYDSDSYEETPALEEDDDTQPEPLTEDRIKERLADIKQTKKNARRERTEIEEQVREIREEMRGVKSEMASVRAKMNAICIAGRNEYSRKAIQQDFAAGIKELDQENAAEEDEENFNPDEELRNYDEVALSLPVFCVSSRAYQKLCGRLVKDGTVPGFETKEETEIPQLQAHCKKLTEAGRVQACRQFLVNLKQQLNSLYLWSCNDGTGIKLSDEDLRREVHYLNKKLAELEKSLDEAVESYVKQMKQELTEQIFEKYPEVIEEAANTAPGTAAKWGAPRGEGGMYWASYKATVRRDGVYESASAGKRDFNNELTEPIQKRLATGWERAFQRRLPNALQSYATKSSQILSNFHHAVEQRARLNGAGIANLQLLSQQINNYEEIFKGLSIALNASMIELQREANREFTPVVTSIMHAVYQVCTDERGPGSFMRMKKAMNDYVEQTRHTMFLQATQAVRDRLNQMCRALEKTMSEKSDQIFFHMRRDYLSLIGGAQINQEVVMSKAERFWRAEIKALLMTIDDEFRGPANGENEGEKPSNEEADDSDGEEDFESHIEEQGACKESGPTSRAGSPAEGGAEQTDADIDVDFN